MTVGAPTKIADATTLATCIAVDATRVYFSDFSGGTAQILSVPLAGGNPATVASGGDKYACVAVDGAGVYYFDNGSVMKAPLGGGGGTALATGQDLLKGTPLVVAGGTLYWITDVYGTLDGFSGKNAIVRMSTKGGSVDVIAADVGINAGGLAVDGTNIYYSDNDGLFVRSLANPMTAVKIDQPAITPPAFTVGAGHVLVAEVMSIGTGDVAVMRPDGMGRQVLTTSLGKPFAVDDGGAYIGLSGALERVSLDGATTLQLATVGAKALALATDRIVFTDGATLWSIPR
jgi:hypothetical protein